MEAGHPPLERRRRPRQLRRAGPGPPRAPPRRRSGGAGLLLLAGCPDEIHLAAAKTASFFLRAGQEWLGLGRVDLATACFEGHAARLRHRHGGGRSVLLDLNLAQALAASHAGDQSLAVALLSRSKPLASASPKGTRSLAEGYLSVGEATLSAKPSDPAVGASSLLTEALDLFEKLASPSPSSASPKTPNLNEQKGRCLRYLALERLEAKDHEGVLRCIQVSRASVGLAGEHPSVGFMALHAWLGTGNLAEAERELERIMANANAPESVCVGAAEVYLASAGPEAARKVLVALAARCRAGGAAAAVRVVTKVVDGGINGAGAQSVGELVSDERVVALFDGPANTSHRGAMHTLLWNCGVEHFNAKNYDTCADLFERSMLYLSREEGSRARRAQCLRVLAVCYLALQRLDRAHEFVNEADKVEHNAHCAFMKLLPSIWPSVSVASDQADANNFLFLHTFYSYQLLDRMDTSTHPQQLQLVKNFASSKACTPSHLLKLGKAASEGTPPNLLVAEFSLKASIKSALASHSPDYRVISSALRNLACLAGLQDLSGSKSDAVYDVYRQAYQIMVGLRDGEYPCEEGQWLAASAWNKSYLAKRLNQASVGIKWMKMGLDLSRHVESMKQYIADMEQCLEYFQKMFHSEAGEHTLHGKNPDECSQQRGTKHNYTIDGITIQTILVENWRWAKIHKEEDQVHMVLYDHCQLMVQQLPLSDSANT
ncbi:hypothetical protein ZWY2020_046899 [Hordeum vulgare]|nr:hypothetical protein ZWY2020_046899 [Hordeum vulgare]